MKKYNYLILLTFILLNHTLPGLCMTTQERMDKDIREGKPIVIQVSVALADNRNQWIVPVPKSLGNGQNPATNLYWGARYGVKTFLIKDAGWVIDSSINPDDKRILERVVFKKAFFRRNQKVNVYLVADAWDGKYIKDTIRAFLNYNSGNDTFDIHMNEIELSAGGHAHLIVYIGHNALMDFAGMNDLTVSNPPVIGSNPDNDAMVLACKSKAWFFKRLSQVGANPVLLTSGLMAPEAYSLNAAITEWIEGKDVVQVRKAAAGSYSKYQKIGLKAAERLFGVE